MIVMMARRYSVCIVLLLCAAGLQQVANTSVIDEFQSTSNSEQQTIIVVALTGSQQVNTEQQQPAEKTGDELEDDRRPIWNLAHMVNSIKDLDYRLRKGANGVEADVTFGRNGDPLYTYHGFPCDCWRHCNHREDFHKYLRYVREIAIEKVDGIGQNLTIMFLDLKLGSLDMKAKARAGQELAKSLVENFFTNSDTVRKSAIMSGPLIDTDPIPTPERMIRLIVSVNHVTDIELVRNFLLFMEEHNANHLMDRIGFDVGMNDDLVQIDSMWRPLKDKLNLWQGDGITNCLSPFYNLDRLSQAIQRRDDIQGYPSKVYQWSIDTRDQMRVSLRMGVDAIMTNHPERLVTVLREPEMAHKYRLANLVDNPFKKISNHVMVPKAKSNHLDRHQRSALTASRTQAKLGGFMRGLIDILGSCWAYLKKIPFLSFPTTKKAHAKGL